MPDVVIEDPIINSRFGEPERHFRIDDEGITSEIIPGRPVSSHFMPIPRAKMKGKAGKQLNNVPDFIAHIDNSRGDPLGLIIEIPGEPDEDKAAKVATARTFWVPAANDHDGFGRWALVENSDPWDPENTIRGRLRALAGSDQAGT